MYRPVCAFCACFLALLSVLLGAKSQTTAPSVTGVAGIRLLAADIEKSRRFYGKELGLHECHSGAALCFQVNTIQTIELDSLSKVDRPDRLSLVAFETRDVAALHQFILAQGISSGEPITLTNGSKGFDVLDPEGHAVEFVDDTAELIGRLDA